MKGHRASGLVADHENDPLTWLDGATAHENGPAFGAVLFPESRARDGVRDREDLRFILDAKIVEVERSGEVARDDEAAVVAPDLRPRFDRDDLPGATASARNPIRSR